MIAAMRAPARFRPGDEPVTPGRDGIPRACLVSGRQLRMALSCRQADEDGVIRMVPQHRAHTLRVLLVDDHLMMSEALALRLSSVPDLWVAGTCTTSDPNLPDIVRRLQPDVITIETEPLGSSAGRGAAVAGRGPATGQDRGTERRPGCVARGRGGPRRGAAWVSKQQDAAELETVLRGMLAGSAWFPPRILGAVPRELREDIDSARDGGGLLNMLSRREREVLLGMVQGKHARQIGAELMISLDTVRTHTRNIFAKLDVHSRLEAVRIAHVAGMGADGRRR
jgi:two-component system, NarL family, response regulator LiaR